jgi:hypothetical protein
MTIGVWNDRHRHRADQHRIVPTSTVSHRRAPRRTDEHPVAQPQAGAQQLRENVLPFVDSGFRRNDEPGLE